MAKSPANDAKLKEYLELMKAPSKPKTSLGDLNMVDAAAADTEQAKNFIVPKNLVSSDDDTKPKKSREESLYQPQGVKPFNVGAQTPEESSKTVSTAPVKEISDRAVSDEAVNTADATGAQEEKSDMDWMRSRTSRLLGLLDDDEDEEAQAQAVNVVKPPIQDDISAETNADEVADSRTMAMDISPQIDETQVDVEDEAILASGRLFLRNLPYSVTEAEIKELFEPDGDVQEVGRSLFASFVFRYVMIFLIGTAYVRN